MRFIHTNNLDVVTRITGPTHHYLALELSRSLWNSEPIVEAFTLDGELDSAANRHQCTVIRDEVLQGVHEVNETLRSTFGVERIRYCSADPYIKDCYRDLAYALVTHRVREGDLPSGYSEATPATVNSHIVSHEI